METEGHALAGLDADIGLLSGFLAESIRELSGEEILHLVQGLRDDAVALREGRLPGGRERFGARLAELDTGRLELVARAFTQWFHLVNAAEEQHRIRVLRQRDRADNPTEGSLAAAFAQLRDAGVSAADVRAMLSRLFVMPVLTAHPTEARRRTVIEHLGAPRSSSLSRTRSSRCTPPRSRAPPSPAPGTR
jgi:phosphoenolpyruvate carboxylase